MKTIIVSLLFILFFIAGFFTSEIISQNKKEPPVQPQVQCKSQLKEALIIERQTASQEAMLLEVKKKAVEDVVESHLYFTSQVISLSPTKSKIIISLIGGAQMKTDASDLTILYPPEHIAIREIQQGASFPLYPRQLAEGGVITITGIARLMGETIQMGEPNRIFVTLVVEKIGTAGESPPLSIDGNRTSVFLQGKSVLNIGKSVKEINP